MYTGTRKKPNWILGASTENKFNNLTHGSQKTKQTKNRFTQSLIIALHSFTIIDYFHIILYLLSFRAFV